MVVRIVVMVVEVVGGMLFNSLDIPPCLGMCPS